jgi:hypothetical protein
MVKAKRNNVVESAITKIGGSPAELARRLTLHIGEEVTRQRVHGWRLRGTFPRDMMIPVEEVIGIPLSELIAAKPRDRDEGNVVNRAIRYLGADATPAMLAAALQKLAGRRITRQMVNGWQAVEQFPIDVVPFVHMLTKIPVKELVEGRKAKKSRSSEVRREARLKA